jgi:hypothetical protein
MADLALKAGEARQHCTVYYCTAVFWIGAAYYRELESFSAAGDRRVTCIHTSRPGTYRGKGTVTRTVTRHAAIPLRYASHLSLGNLPASNLNHISQHLVRLPWNKSGLFHSCDRPTRDY